MTWPPKPKRLALWVGLHGGLKPNGAKSTATGQNSVLVKPMPRLKTRSKPMTALMRLYVSRVRLFLRHNQCCVVFPNLKSEQCHHVFGRRGRLLLWEPGWKSVSAAGHAWIGANPAEARRLGLVGPVGTWNDYDRAVEFVAKSACVVS